MEIKNKIKKAIQSIATLIITLILLVSHGPVCAAEACSDEELSNRFFAKNECFPLHFGIKSWATVTRNIIDQSATNGTAKAAQQSWAIGEEFAIGPFVEWKPLHGIGIQTGLLYSYHYLLALSLYMNEKNIIDTGFFSFFSNAFSEFKQLNSKDKCGGSIDPVKLHTLSLPLSLRLYPEKTRQLVLYGGARVVIIVSGTRKAQLCNFNIDADEIKYNIAEQGIKEGIQSIFQKNPYRLKDQKVNFSDGRFSLDWDFGFEFNGKAGFIIGINKLGLLLGYDCTKLFCKQ